MDTNNTKPNENTTPANRAALPLANWRNWWIFALLLGLIQPAMAVQTNVALASAGGVATASSSAGAGFPVSSIINNERTGAVFANGGAWEDGTSGVFPDWVQINFAMMNTIDHVVVYSLEDNYPNPVEPTDTMTFANYGVVSFTVQGWNGTAWVTLSTVTGNNLVKRTVPFTAFTTDRIRVNINSGVPGYPNSILTEVEAWGVGAATPPGAPTNVTAAGGNAKATVVFAAPANNGGAAIVSYTATATPGNQTGSCSAPCTSINVGGLTNGTAYTFTVTATNAVGTSVASAVSNSVTPMAGIVDLQAYYIHADQLDTARLITDTSGNVVWEWQNSDPFGNNPPNENPSGQGTFKFPLRYPGMVADPETGLFQNHFRDYDPTTGRYPESDLLGLYGGSFSTFIYAGGNPLILIDPLGLCWIYSQSTGQMFYQPADSLGGGPPQYVGKGYAGYGSGLNNGEWQQVGGDHPNPSGPLPRGRYTIGPQQDNTLTDGETVLTASMRLTPDDNNKMWGRSGFLIHGPHDDDNNDSSMGCPIFEKKIRNKIGKSGDNCLKVVQ